MIDNHIIGVLPARWGSSRFPGKPLHLIAGKPLIQHVWERCQSCQSLKRVIVATDDERILKGVERFGGEAMMTSRDHPSGTDRIAEIAEKIPDATHVINIQGDEPLIEPDLIDRLVAALAADPGLTMVSAANPLVPHDPAVTDPNVVKVTLDHAGRALYFSRSPIPYPRQITPGLTYYRHKGIYGFRREFLLRFVQWKPSQLEQTECLEQLRALENGAAIQILLSDDDSPGIDTPEQAALLDQKLRSA